MGIFSFSSPQKGVKIPTFELSPQPDSTDLRLRALLYLFKRLRINKLSAFPNSDGSLKYTDSASVAEDSAFSAKLDSLYNLSKFQQLLVSDPQRVLVDFPKNKFRAYCILSELPSSNFSRPSSPVKGGPSDYGIPETENGFPVIVDARGKRVPHFCFSLLLTGEQMTIRELATSLANSLIYVEHHSYVPFSARFQTGKSSIQKVSTMDLSDDSVLRLTEDFKHAVLFEYLRELAFLVQLIRIYDEYMKKTGASTTPSPSIKFSRTPTSSPQTSPVKKSAPTLTSKRSIANLKGERTLKAQPSISNFRSTETYNPVASPQKKSVKAASSSNPNDIYGREIVEELWDKCKTSIRVKLDRESQRIEHSRSTA